MDGYRKSTYFLHYNISLIHTSSDSQVEEQVAVLNHDYRETGLSFVLANTSRTIDAEWFTSAGPDNGAQDSMKSTLRRGDATTLNVYTVGFQTSGGLLGYSTFPADYDSKPSDDGVGTYSVNYLDITMTVSHQLLQLFSTPRFLEELKNHTTLAKLSLTRSATGLVSIIPSKVAAETATLLLIPLLNRHPPLAAQQLAIHARAPALIPSVCRCLNTELPRN